MRPHAHYGQNGWGTHETRPHDKAEDQLEPLSTWHHNLCKELANESPYTKGGGIPLELSKRRSSGHKSALDLLDLFFGPGVF